MTAVVIDLYTMRAVRRAARFRHVPERPAFRVALRELLAGAAPLAAFAKASQCWRNSSGGQPPRGTA